MILNAMNGLTSPVRVIIFPGNPQQNGRHERMHLTLKKEATKPAGFNFLQQQEKFDHFTEEYNNERVPIKL